MSYIETPPMLTGDVQQQLAALRDYLFRLASSLDSVGSAPAVIVETDTKKTQPSSVQDTKTVRDLRENAAQLKALIEKNADNITAIDGKIGNAKNYTDGIADSLTAYVNQTKKDIISATQNTLKSYVAESSFGEYRESVEEAINGLVSKHDYEEEINALNQSFKTMINGQIVRGFTRDPGDPNGPPVLGIAISQELSFNADVVEEYEGHEYYELTCKTFGLYTSQGWQFWLNGQKVGWFDSTKSGLLHVKKVVAEDFLQISGEWQLKINHNEKELEFVYIGS